MSKAAEATSSADSDVLRLYVRYRDYLGAQQLARILDALDETYAAVHRGKFPDHPLTNDAMMRVEKCQTGKSIEVLLIDGLREVLSSDAPIHAAAAMGVVSVVGRVLIKAGQAFVESRKSWYEGSKAKEEALRLSDDRKAREMGVRREPDPLEGLPRAARYEIWARVLRFLYYVEHEDNVTDVSVNGESIISKNGTQ